MRFLPVRSALLVLFYTAKAICVDLIYKKVGDSVVLNPGQSFDSIHTATWKHNTDLALVWFGSQTICSRDFEGRYLLDKKDGSMIIKNLNRQDNGIYTPEINDKVLKKLELQVIEPVPKPTVSVKCNNEKTLCNLTCEANISAEFGPVTYKWRNGEEVLSNDKELIITTENKESSFICELENPVSSNSSDGVDNPISSGKDAPVSIQETNTTNSYEPNVRRSTPAVQNVNEKVLNSSESSVEIFLDSPEWPQHPQ